MIALMIGIGAVELLILAILFVLVLGFGVYWVIRLATRHGAEDAQRRAGGSDRPPL
jgi:hypothetical protein